MNAADAVVVVHFGFVVFVVFGGLLVLRWPRAAWAHVPAAVWGALVQFGDWMCPLTYLEAALRDQPVGASFVDQTLLPLLYPDLLREGILTPTVRVGIGLVVVAVNVAIYAIAVSRARSKGSGTSRTRALRTMLSAICKVSMR